MSRLTALLVLIISLASPALADEGSAFKQLENTKATLVAEYDSVKAGTPIDLALILEPKPQWHTYWENPGDAGMPTELKWTLPEGFKAGEIDWPAPDHLAEGPLLTYSYKSTAFLPVTITPPESLKTSESYTIKVKAQWLVCKDICVPESADLEVSLPATDGIQHPSGDSTLFIDHRNTRPEPIQTHGNFTLSQNKLVFSIPLSTLKIKDVKTVQFSIREQNIMNYAAEQKFTVEKDTLVIETLHADEQPMGALSGILSITSNADSIVHHYNVVFDLNNPIAAAVATNTTTATTSSTPASQDKTEDLWFPLVLLFAVLGGLVLNLMPCVLPILSLKALAIAKKGGGKHEHVVAQGVAYTLGILLTFTVIASILLILRSTGESVGWGYQMQSPAFVAFLIYLLFMVGLSLSGVFHLPVLLGNVGGDIANESSTRGSFFTGVLATAVATPCTAPFMASAVGAALTMPPLQALLVFEALGFGLALPFLLISLFPRLRKFLPKPGAWMDTFKQLIAFPMYASVIWLMWVLTLQTGAGGMVVALSGMLLIVVVIWMKSLFEDGSKAYTFTALALYALLLLGTLPQLGSMEVATAALPGGHAEHGVETVEYSKEKRRATHRCNDENIQGKRRDAHDRRLDQAQRHHHRFPQQLRL